ncbi:MAG TPA: acyl carrier protein [Anaerolineales bacterium]|jgi:acyl carrier protein|nr:acyl carrier protein [Anaerolineales bacterium]
MNIKAEIEHFVLNNLLIGNSRTKIDPDESLIADGIIDSLALLQLIAFIEEQFAITVEDDEVVPENFQTITMMSSLVERKLQI